MVWLDVYSFVCPFNGKSSSTTPASGDWGENLGYNLGRIHTPENGSYHRVFFGKSSIFGKCNISLHLYLQAAGVTWQKYIAQQFSRLHYQSAHMFSAW